MSTDPILRRTGRGRRNAEIAESLVVFEVTVKPHVGHIFAKLEPRDRSAAIVFAVDHGIVTAELTGTSGIDPVKRLTRSTAS